ncbi:MAG TPA: SusC/RagA family TonB-linked outer membrane protein [Membranihabitans sp.]|nr:SusC/RagA family TonB-linked outer membrane protein [Membranihabitans sp.]
MGFLRRTGFICFLFLGGGFLSLFASNEIGHGLEEVSMPIDVTGRIIDVDGEPLIGVNILVKGSGKGTTTDFEGQFTLDDVDDRDVLIISYLGYETQEVSIEGRTSLDIILQENAQTLDEIVVTALGIEREKKALGYSVTEVLGSELARASTVNPITALQGKVAGVQINTTAGGTFGNSRITIRGNSTFGANTQPIFVVDGVIMDNDVGGVWGNQLKNLNPDDFESFSVLKGTAATALYGSRALNGVVIVTTKKGESRNGLGVSLNQTTGIRYVYDEPAFQNEYGYGGVTGLFSNDQTNGKLDGDSHDAQQFTNYDPVTKMPSLQHNNSEENAASWGPRFEGQEYIDYDGSIARWIPQPDNYKKMFETGVLNNTNISIEGAGESNSFRMSYSNFSESGVQPLNDFKKHSFSIKGAQDLLKDIVQVVGNVSYTTSEASNPPTDLMQDGWFHDGFPRNYNPDKWRNNYKDIDGGVPYPTGTSNYLYTRASMDWFELLENRKTRVESSLLSKGDINVNITEGISAKISGYINQFTFKGEEKTSATSEDRLSNARYYLLNGSKFQSSFSASVFGDKQINNNFSIGFLIGGETWSTKTTSTGAATSSGFKVRDFYNINNSDESPSFSGGIGAQKTINSVYSYLNLDYLSTWYLQLTGRNDWSSALVYPDGSGDNSYFYPSVSLSWILSETLDFPDFISFVKLRSSYAMVGNDTDPYRLSTGFVPVVFSQEPTLNIYKYENNTAVSVDLKPEIKQSFEAGIDLRFFNGRMALDLAYYKDNTRNQILALSVPIESGISSQLINAGNLQNQGVEGVFSITPVESKNFSWDISVTGTHNRDKVIELYPGVEEIILDGNPGDANAGTATIAYAGGDYGILATRRGYRYYQATDEAGNPINHKNNGKPILYQRNAWSVAYMNGNSNLDSLHIVGNMQPDFIGAITNTFRYKRFMLSAMIDSRIGGEIYSNAYRYGLHQGVLQGSLPNRDSENGGIVWTSEGMGQNYFGKTYEDGFIPDGVFPEGTQISFKDADKVTYRTEDVSGMTYQEAYDAGLVEPTHWSGYMYRWTSASTGTSLMGIHTLNWVALREVSLSYSIPESFSRKLFVQNAGISLTARDVGFLHNSMPDNINPIISDNRAGNARQMGFAPYVRSITFALKINF